MPEESEFHNLEALQITQISPPIFPDNVAIRVGGGFGRLQFVTIPDPSKPNNLVIVADIVSNPAFMLKIAEYCLAAVKLFAPDAKIDEVRVEQYRSSLEISNIAPSHDKEGENDNSV